MSDREPTVRQSDDMATPAEAGLALEDELVGAAVRARLFPSQATTAIKIGRFTMLERVGSGGMGVVYAAYDSELDRKVAIKLLHVDKQAGSEGKARLLREAQAMAKLAHPNVCTVHEVGMFRGNVYIAMEFIRGKTLNDWRIEKDRTWKETLDVFLQAGRGLAAAHAAGVVHRDFKPDNVIVGNDGRVRVLDFGLARPAEEVDVERSYMLPPSDAGAKELDTPLTLTGAVLGTPAYMSPEQHQGRQADERSDQFSFCVALYEALFGERPYAGETKAELSDSVLEGRMRELPKGTKVPTHLRRVVRRGLSTKPGDRYPSVDALLHELRRDPEKTKRRVIAAAAVAAVVGLGGWGLSAAQKSQSLQCTGAEEKLADIWDDTRKQEVRGALLATGRPYAEDTWTRVEKRLDSYTQDWVAMHTDACEATHLRGEQSGEMLDLRMACLGSRLTDLRALVDVLADADAEVLDKSIRAAAGLKLLDRCADADALAAAIPSPDNPEVAAKVEELRDKLARAKALEDAGKYKEGLPIAEEAAEAAKPLDYPPLEAEALVRLGVLQHWIGDLEAAKKTLAEAYWVALGAKHDEVPVEAATWLATLIPEPVGRDGEAPQWARHAQAAVERIGLGGVEEAKLRWSLGASLREQGRLDEARAHLERAVAIYERTVGLAHPDVPFALLTLGAVLDEQGKDDQALAHYDRGLAAWERAFGPEHPLVAAALNNVGKALIDQGKYDRAREHLERSRAIFERSLGPEHFMTGYPVATLGMGLRQQGKYDEALEHHERALAIWEKAYGREDPRVAKELNDYGYTLYELGRYDEALRCLERALAINEKVLGPEHRDTANAYDSLGEVLIAKGEHDEAREHLERALAIGEKTLGPEDPFLAFPLTGLGQVSLAEHKPAEAVRLLEQALAVRERANDSAGSYALARTDFALARALWETGKGRKLAVELAKKARVGYENAGKAYARYLAEVEAWLREHDTEGRTR